MIVTILAAAIGAFNKQRTAMLPISALSVCAW
jgi:hypothetical protein